MWFRLLIEVFLFLVYFTDVYDMLCYCGSLLQYGSVATETVCLDDLERLDRMDLLELLPGVEKLKLRKQIFEIIHPQVPKILLTQAGCICTAQMSH